MNYNDRLNNVIPGGAHTYSRGEDQYPANAPQILTKGSGCYVWDADGNKFLDYGMALRAVTVGYAYKEIADAAIHEIWNGNNLTRPSMIELEAAELITGIIDSADMVKFGKNGSTVTTAAIKLARAFNGKKYVLRCLDHPFFSYDDWFIGDTSIQRGIPGEISAMTLNFRYNDISSLIAQFDQHPGEISCVIMEPVTSAPPVDGFLQKVQQLCKKHSAVFILDEMITGFRWHLGGAQRLFGLDPDISTFGKGMANGFSVAALTGKREIMELGGIRKSGQERVFLMSTTHGAEMCGLGAFVKTMEVYRELDVIRKLWDFGGKLIEGMNAIAASTGISDYFCVEGYPCSPTYVTRDKNGQPSLWLRTIFSEQMISNGVLMPWIALSYAHGEEELEKTLYATEKSLLKYRIALEENLPGKVNHLIKPVFRKFN